MALALTARTGKSAISNLSMQNAPSFASLPRASKSRGAFSLLEVAIALVIFVIGAIALLRIFPSGLNVLENSGNRRVAAQMSQNVLTSYNSGDLASTTPDAIYDFNDTTGLWNDYPASALGLRRQAGTVPVNPDDFNSAKDALKFISGERQGISNGAVYTNYPADRRVDLLREGVVGNVAINSKGELDFRNAAYIDNKRTDKPKLPFREPILSLGSIVDTTASTSVPINGDAATIQRDATTDKTYTITFALDSSDVSNTVNLMTAPANAVTFNAPAGFDCTSTTDPASPNTAKTLVVKLKVPRLTTPSQANQIVTYSVSNINGVSNSRATYAILIAGDSTNSPAPVSDNLLPIRAPFALRQQGVTFYLSYSWILGASTTIPQPYGVVNQPTLLPSNETSPGGVVFAGLNQATVGNGTDVVVANPTATLSFIQPLTTVNTPPDRVTVGIPNLTFADSDGPTSSTTLSQVLLNYNTRSWEYIAEDISQFGAPFPGSNTPLDTSTPQGTVVSEFMDGAGYTTPMPLSDVREIRTRIGNLRGVVQVKGFYEQSSQPFDVPAFNINSSTPPNGSTVTPQDYARQKKALAKQGRLFLPANFKSGMNILPLSHARVYYRSKDAWVQQVGVAASHYVPFIANAPAREPWREYFQGSDGYLYFHATEAGKTVECAHGTTVSDASADQVEIIPDVQFVTAVPAGMSSSSGFTTTTFTNANNSSDPRNGKFYLARSRNRVSGNIFDVRRPTGTSGISVRTMWLDGTRYAQEIAQ